MATTKTPRPTTTVELGPDTRALLRKILLALEMLLGETVPDPGLEFEDAEE